MQDNNQNQEQANPLLWAFSGILSGLEAFYITTPEELAGILAVPACGQTQKTGFKSTGTSKSNTGCNHKFPYDEVSINKETGPGKKAFEGIVDGFKVIINGFDNVFAKKDGSKEREEKLVSNENSSREARHSLPKPLYVATNDNDSVISDLTCDYEETKLNKEEHLENIKNLTIQPEKNILTYSTVGTNKNVLVSDGSKLDKNQTAKGYIAEIVNQEYKSNHAKVIKELKNETFCKRL